VDTLSTNLGVGGLTTQLKLPLLTVMRTLGTRCRSLVTAVSADTLFIESNLVNISVIQREKERGTEKGRVVPIGVEG
jgi:hypothetical protein